jgi:hypothetical protein
MIDGEIFQLPQPDFRRVMAAAKVIHDYGVMHGWSGFKGTYDDLKKRDHIGWCEFNSIIAEALMEADKHDR